MSAFPRSAHSLPSLAAFGLVSCLASAASAQPAPPDPFEDYERFTAGGPAPTPELPPAPGVKLQTAPWKWSMGLRSQLSFSRLTYQREGGQNDGAATALLFRVSPALHVFVLDRLQLGLSPGLLVRSGGNDVGDDATDANMLVEVTGHYFAPLSPRFSFVPGVGLGGYFGAGTRKTAASGPARAERDTKTAGLSLALYMGIAYQMDDHLQLRSGLTGSVYLGWDHVQDREGRVQNSAVHIGIPIELFYTF